jgi:hypothetical protein
VQARDAGFTKPGRFAVLYTTAFGETPLTTLRQGRDGEESLELQNLHSQLCGLPSIIAAGSRGGRLCLGSGRLEEMERH